MGDEIEMKLMFVNYDAPLADEVLKGVKITQPVSDVKKRIMAERWPEDHTPLEKIQRIRVFVGGRELQDASHLKEYKTSFHPTGPTPVHIAYVLKSSADESNGGTVGEKKETEAARPQCFCAIL
jgi:hypothetical protein